MEIASKQAALLDATTHVIARGFIHGGPSLVLLHSSSAALVQSNTSDAIIGSCGSSSRCRGAVVNARHALLVVFPCLWHYVGARREVKLDFPGNLT